MRPKLRLGTGDIKVSSSAIAMLPYYFFFFQQWLLYGKFLNEHAVKHP